MFEPEKKDEADEADGSARIKTDLYVIDWGRDRWTLGYKPGTFEHLERLYIDQDGDIHGIESKEPRHEPEAKTEPSSNESAENENDPDETDHDENGKE